MEAPLDPTVRNSVLRDFTYGLYVVSASHRDEHGIFTANWVSQVSFDPSMVVVSIERDSSTLSIIRESGRFAISTLAAGQRELAGALGKPKSRVGDKTLLLKDRVQWIADGIPLPADALGYVLCTLTSITEAGDSFLVLGEVSDVGRFRDGIPLTMREAGFRHAG